MRSLTAQQQLEAAVMAHLRANRSPQTCNDVAKAVGTDAFTARSLLVGLVESGEVLEFRFKGSNGKDDRVVYEPAHGGYDPEAA